MNLKIGFVLISLSVLPFFTQASFLPENEIIVQKAFGPSNITEADFRARIAAVSAIYTPIVESFGGRLSIDGDWSSEVLNASARQLLGSWQVKMSGGLARTPTLTGDGFSLIICHEMGHHLAGFAFSSSFPIPISGLTDVWAANEGQSDYFATQECAKKLWGQDYSMNASFRSTVKADIKKVCDENWNSTVDQDLCYRVLEAAQSLSNTLAVLKQKPLPKIETPDETIVNRTNNSHPEPQCRLDTSLQGAICKAPFDDKLIPGKNVSAGVRSIEAETEAARTSCTAFSGYSVGLRPACWYKARL